MFKLFHIAATASSSSTLFHHFPGQIARQYLPISFALAVMSSNSNQQNVNYNDKHYFQVLPINTIPCNFLCFLFFFSPPLIQMNMMIHKIMVGTTREKKAGNISWTPQEKHPAMRNTHFELWVNSFVIWGSICIGVCLLHLLALYY